MNILHIAPYFPSVNAIHAGGRAMGKEVETLRKQGHEVYILSFIQKEYDVDLYEKERNEADSAIQLNRNGKIKNIIKHIFTPLYFATRNDDVFYQEMVEMIEKYHIEAIHAEYSAMLQYVRIKRKYPHIKFVGILHDITVQSYVRKYQSETNAIKKYFYGFEGKRIKKYEQKYLTQCDEICSFSDKDQKLISDLYGLESHYINTYFNLDEIRLTLQRANRIDDGLTGFCFVGQMGRKENEEAAIRLIHLFNNVKRDNKKLYIVGANAGDDLKAMESENVHITGFVDDIDEFLIEHCDVACFPLMNGAGIKIKVLECMALGLPVITNAIGAEGIDEDGKLIYLATTDEEFLALMESIEAGKNSEYQQYIEDRFGWKRTEDVFETIYGNC